MRSLSGLALYEKNDNLINYLVDIRELIINKVKNDSKLDTAWIIVSWVDDEFKEKFKEHENVEYILMDTSREECISRIEEDEERQSKDETIQIINDWFDRYEREQNSIQKGVRSLAKYWEVKAKSENEGELLIYGDIEDIQWWNEDVTPTQMKKALDDLGDIKVLNVYVNSYGGSVFAGQAIHTMLKRHKAKVNVHIDGIAASIASVIAMAGDTVTIPANAMIMVHNPWTFGLGNANDFRKLADDLDKIGESIVAAYQGKTGLDEDKIKELMDAETWLTAKEAVEYGFADKIEEEKQIAASIDGDFLMCNGQKFDLTRYQKRPDMKTTEQPKSKGQVPVDIYKKMIENRERRLKYV